MTTHDRDKVIAIAEQVKANNDMFGDFSVALYAIAFDDGRQADKADAERYRWLCNIGMSLLHPAFAASSITSWKTKAEIDDGIDRARGDTK